MGDFLYEQEHINQDYCAVRVISDSFYSFSTFWIRILTPVDLPFLHLKRVVFDSFPFRSNSYRNHRALT